MPCLVPICQHLLSVFLTKNYFSIFQKLLIYWSDTIVKKLSEDPRSYINRAGYKNLHILGSYQEPCLYSNQILSKFLG